MSNFPVQVNNIVKQSQINLGWICQNESKYLAGKNITCAGSYPLIINGSTTGANWKGATRPTVVANTWYQNLNTCLYADAGRRLVLTRIRIAVDQACSVALVQQYVRKQALDGSNVGIGQVGSIGTMIGENLVSTGGVIEFNLMDKPLILSSGQRLDFHTLNATTSGTNWAIFWEGYDITDDDYNKPLAMCFIGDSIASQTTDSNMQPFSQREDGTINGIFGNIMQQHCADHGINARRVVLGIPGSSAIDWDAIINSKRVGNWANYDFVNVNLGMNDCISDTGLTVTSGVDGIFKKAIKNIIRSYFRENYTGSMIVNNITATDLSTRTTNVASGIYAGQQRVVAYRTEISLAVSEMKTAFPAWDLQFCDTSAAYNSSQTTYFAETSAGTYTHPNTTLGQPAMAVLLNTKLDLSTFFLKNKTR